jgi:ATP-dependent helicase/nuclease subunit B
MILTYAHAAIPTTFKFTLPMAAIATIAASAGAVDADFWPRLAHAVRAAWRKQGIEPRDAVVLMPYANLLPVARAAFAQTGDWQPRIETPATLADALGPPAAWAEQQVTGDMRIDGLQAQRMLAATEQGAGLAQTLAALAQALSQAQAAWPPEERAQRWQDLRDEMPPLPAGAPGGVERGLLRAAIAWAAVHEQTPADRLWRHRFPALVVVQGGGEQGVAQALMNAAASAGTPVLRVMADLPADEAFEAVASLPPPRSIVCDDAAHEAREAAWAVVEALEAGHKPVALVAQDRQIVRRIHAVLAERGWGVHDDTGWALSTTRAAARAVAVLRAVQAPASRDAQLDAMKAMAWSGGDLATLDALEQAWRNDRSPSPGAAALLERWQRQCAGLRDAQAQPLQGWLQVLAERFSPLWLSLSADPAGRAVVQALWLDRTDAASAEPARQSASAMPLRWAALLAWAEQALEQAAYMPAPAAEPDVIITPLARTVLRPFGAVVFAACDERLGAASAAPMAWPMALAEAHGLPHDGQRRERERAAFVQLLRQPRVVLLRRRSHAGEPMAPCRWVEQAQSARRRLGQALIAERAACARTADVPLQAVPPPQPRALSADQVPERWSASLVEALRACPYRFFSRGVLRLGEAAELDLDWQKRDHGDWLHKVLYRFHLARPAARSLQEDIAALLAAAQAESDVATGQLGRDGADLLPFEAGFASFAQHYVEWLQARDAQGWRYAKGEIARERVLPGLAPSAMLVGRIDRVDEHANQGFHLIDYKTGGAAALKRKVREPLEDTQLAAYAALMQADVEPTRPLQASYLALDDRAAPESIEHRHASESARALMQALPAEIARLREGAAMPALGEGNVCEFCEARGLCRRDHWAPLT